MGKKNIVWIVTDQQRYETLSINGGENSCTPNIDSLARTGLNFTQAYSGFPLCCPFRGSMLTGIYPHKCVPGHEYRLDPAQPTVASVFSEYGYDTFYLGKWHLDGHKETEDGCRTGTFIVPRERRGGFRSWLGYENNNAQYDCYLHGHKGDTEIPQFRIPKYETDGLTDIFLKYLEERAGSDTPFFAVLSVQPPHDPYVAPAEFQKNHKPADIRFLKNVPNVLSVQKRAAKELAGYYSMVENIDWNVGRIVSCLRENGLLDDTHILYFSDHGDMHGSHGQFRKTTAYQEAVHIPFIISGEKYTENTAYRSVRNVEEVLINHVDIAPTSLGLCGIPVPSWMEGTDYSALRLPNKPQGEYPDSVYLQSVIPTGHEDSVNKAWRGIITADGYKYVCFEQMDWLLFDLKEDPFEQVNLAHNEVYRSLRKRLRQELKDWITKTGDSFDVPEL